MTQTATIAYGPTYTAEVTALIGENLWDAPVIDSHRYTAPTFNAYQLTDGRVVKVVEGAMYNRFEIFADWATYSAVKYGTYGVERDPETGRL